MATEKATISVDLEKYARRELNFLKEVDAHPNLYNGSEVVKQAIWRYEQFWLPLKAKHQQQELEPPLDVGWLWHVHLLSPAAYRKDCQAAVGVSINRK